MRIIDYVDDRGRKYKVELPDGAPDADAEMGIFIGPADVVDNLGFPEPFATRLHNELYARGLLTLENVQANSRELQAALQAALKVDIQTLYTAYVVDDRQAVPV